MADSKKLTCPFCGGEVIIRVCDEEGNFQPPEYEHEPWSGLGFVLYHDRTMSKGTCPIAHHVDEHLGIYIFNDRESAEKSWENRS